jgi:hypothetical protein
MLFWGGLALQVGYIELQNHDDEGRILLNVNTEPTQSLESVASHTVTYSEQIYYTTMV